MIGRTTLAEHFRIADPVCSVGLARFRSDEAADCTGASKGLVPGVTAYAQYWSRDPGYPAPTNIGLTNAVSFVVCP